MRLNNTQIKQALTTIRTDLREGKVRVSHENRAETLKTVIGLELRSRIADIAAIHVTPQGVFDTQWMNPQTAKRFDAFFAAVPTGGCLAQDDVAWALQNFINRRAEPWAFLARREETTDLSKITVDMTH
jgi:hypothetical protein